MRIVGILASRKPALCHFPLKRRRNKDAEKDNLLEELRYLKEIRLKPFVCLRLVCWFVFLAKKLSA